MATMLWPRVKLSYINYFIYCALSRSIAMLPLPMIADANPASSQQLSAQP